MGGKQFGKGTFPILQEEFKELIRLESRKDNEAELNIRKAGWDSKFTKYWEQFVDPRVEFVGGLQKN